MLLLLNGILLSKICRHTIFSAKGRIFYQGHPDELCGCISKLEESRCKIIFYVNLHDLILRIGEISDWLRKEAYHF